MAAIVRPNRRSDEVPMAQGGFGSAANPDVLAQIQAGPVKPKPQQAPGQTEQTLAYQGQPAQLEGGQVLPAASQGPPPTQMASTGGDFGPEPLVANYLGGSGNRSAVFTPGQGASATPGQGWQMDPLQTLRANPGAMLSTSDLGDNGQFTAAGANAFQGRINNPLNGNPLLGAMGIRPEDVQQLAKQMSPGYGITGQVTPEDTARALAMINQTQGTPEARMQNQVQQGQLGLDRQKFGYASGPQGRMDQSFQTWLAGNPQADGQAMRDFLSNLKSYNSQVHPAANQQPPGVQPGQPIPQMGPLAGPSPASATAPGATPAPGDEKPVWDPIEALLQDALNKPSVDASGVPQMAGNRPVTAQRKPGDFIAQLAAAHPGVLEKNLNMVMPYMTNKFGTDTVNQWFGGGGGRMGQVSGLFGGNHTPDVEEQGRNMLIKAIEGNKIPVGRQAAFPLNPFSWAQPRPWATQQPPQK